MATISGKVASKFVCTGASISAERITKRFGKIQALDGISLSVEPGTVFALLGPNGSGKTTIVRILTTLLRPDSGIARVGDYDVVREANSVRSIIGLAGQYPAVDENLTGKENLEMIGLLYHLGKQRARTRSAELLENFNLTDAGNRRVKTYSGGMRRRLDLAATLVANPPILFLDEPTTGLDPRSRLGLWDVINQQAKNCNTVFLTTQYLEEADRLANKIAIMDNGKIIREGTPQELKDCCGGETHIKIRVTDRTRTLEAVEALRELNKESVYGVPETGEVSIPAIGGTSMLADVVRRMDAAGIGLDELALKPPTLDDVFLAITGHTTEKANEVTEAKPADQAQGENR
ncbi:MAG: ATP-binding cassette domain-containing protein [Dehalococcoidia bacterium]|nr:MAG: ATP-binding cassette domain-containing protein [Dehalococcoidia bacterium]